MVKYVLLLSSTLSPFIIPSFCQRGPSFGIESIVTQIMGCVNTKIIFDYYEPYIIKLSKLPYINNEGEVAYVIDEDIYMSLKLKLHELIINFKVA